MQIDRLVQLLETPAFAFLRLQLLQPTRYPDLVRAMYGLLMLLPQSNAFKTLHARLSSAPMVGLMQLEELQHGASKGSGGKGSSAAAAVGPSTWAPFDELLAGFKQRQEAHSSEEDRKRAVLEGLLIEEDIQKEQQAQAAAAAFENGDARGAPAGNASP